MYQSLTRVLKSKKYDEIWDLTLPAEPGFVVLLLLAVASFQGVNIMMCHWYVNGWVYIECHQWCRPFWAASFWFSGHTSSLTKYLHDIHRDENMFRDDGVR